MHVLRKTAGKAAFSAADVLEKASKAKGCADPITTNGLDLKTK